MVKITVASIAVIAAASQVAAAPVTHDERALSLGSFGKLFGELESKVGLATAATADATEAAPAAAAVAGSTSGKISNLTGKIGNALSLGNLANGIFNDIKGSKVATTTTTVAAAPASTAAPAAAKRDVHADLEERAFSLGALSSLAKLGKAAKPAEEAASVAGKASKGSGVLSKLGTVANVGFLGASLLGGSGSDTSSTTTTSSAAAPPPAATPAPAASSSGGGFLSSIENDAKSLFGLLKRDFSPEEEQVVSSVLAARKRDLSSADEDDLSEIHQALVERGFAGINLPGAAGNIKSILEIGIKAIEQSKVKPRPAVIRPIPKLPRRDVSDLTEEDIQAVHNLLAERGFAGINLPGAAGNIKSVLELGASVLSQATKPPTAQPLAVTHPELFPKVKPLSPAPVKAPLKLPKFL